MAVPEPPATRLIRGARLFGAPGVGEGELGWVLTAGDRIAALGPGVPEGSGSMGALGAMEPGEVVEPVEVVEAEGLILAPGFVDQHCHGGGGVDVTQGADAAREVARTHLLHGTTTLIASLVSAAPSALISQIEALLPLVDDGTFAGIHLEGPWLSTAHCGAHAPELLTTPRTELVNELLQVAGTRLSMVTLAPELEGAIEAVERLAEASVVVALGHSRADAATVRRAVDAGARVATHLFNGMPSMTHREPGIAGALLRDPRVTVELIADGVHVHPDLIAIVVAAAGPDRVSLVTDAMAAAGAPDGSYRLGRLAVEVVDRVARLADSGALAGSTLTMDRAVARVSGTLAGWTEPGSVESGCIEPGSAEPLAGALRMASRTPARVLGLSDRGELSVGSRADLVVLDAEGGVRRVLRAGDWVSR